VDERLDTLRIGRDSRRWYPGEGGVEGHGQLLARVFEPGGTWLDSEDATIEWVDTWFVFGPSLTRWYIERGNQRYFQGEPINTPPEGETAGPTRRYPFPPPAPARPPEGAR